MLFRQLNNQAAASEVTNIVVPSKIIQFALYQYFANLCFGEVLDPELLRELRAVQLGILGLALKLSVFNLLPKVLMLMFLPRLWKLSNLLNRQEELIVPIIIAHRQSCKKIGNHPSKNSYLDKLLALRLKESGRTLSDREIVSLCFEFINAATETTSTALEWIMANLIKHETIQEKLYDSMQQFSTKGDQHVEAERLKNIPYLRAVVLEGLRRHPPAHILLPHTVEKDISLDGYIIPKDAVINYSVAEIGRDNTVWEEPLSFIPERFLKGDDGMNMSVSKEIKMMPFGAGRRACPGEGLAMSVLEYFVANFVRRFHWKPVEGEEIDMTELPGLIVPMKHPFRTRLVSRT